MTGVVPRVRSYRSHPRMVVSTSSLSPSATEGEYWHTTRHVRHRPSRRMALVAGARRRDGGRARIPVRRARPEPGRHGDPGGGRGRGAGGEHRGLVVAAAADAPGTAHSGRSGPGGRRAGGRGTGAVGAGGGRPAAALPGPPAGAVAMV